MVDGDLRFNGWNSALRGALPTRGGTMVDYTTEAVASCRKIEAEDAS